MSPARIRRAVGIRQRRRVDGRHGPAHHRLDVIARGGLRRHVVAIAAQAGNDRHVGQHLPLVLGEQRDVGQTGIRDAHRPAGTRRAEDSGRGKDDGCRTAGAEHHLSEQRGRRRRGAPVAAAIAVERQTRGHDMVRGRQQHRVQIDARCPDALLGARQDVGEPDVVHPAALVADAHGSAVTDTEQARDVEEVAVRARARNLRVCGRRAC